MIKAITFLLLVYCAFSQPVCDDSGDTEAVEQCQCGKEGAVCQSGQYCIFDVCAAYPRCQCHSAHFKVKSPTPHTNPVCLDEWDPSCKESKIGDDGSVSCSIPEDTLCVLGVPPCNCIDDVTPFSPPADPEIPGNEMNKFSCFDPQFRHEAEMTQSDVVGGSGEVLHRFSDGAHKCYSEGEAWDQLEGLCTGTTRRRCRMPFNAPPPEQIIEYVEKVQYVQAPEKRTPIRSARGYMTMDYGVNIKSAQVEMGVSADQAQTTGADTSFNTPQPYEEPENVEEEHEVTEEEHEVTEEEGEEYVLPGPTGVDYVHPGPPGVGRRMESHSLFQSPLLFGMALGAIGTGCCIGAYYTTKMLFKRSDTKATETDNEQQ